jgi:hypothetical protein
MPAGIMVPAGMWLPILDYSITIITLTSFVLFSRVSDPCISLLHSELRIVGYDICCVGP